MIHVGVHKPKDRSNYQLLWIDPRTGKQVRRSSGSRRRRDAELAADRLGKELSAGVDSSLHSWSDFVAIYERQHLPSLSDGSRREWASVRRRFNSVICPRKLPDISSRTLSTYASKLRDDGLSEHTIDKHLRTIRAALSWAAQMDLIASVPRYSRPTRARAQRKMKGRPLSETEFSLMLEATDELLGERRSESWKHLLKGLWLSGLRLSEALYLWWDNYDCIVPQSLDSDTPMLRIPAELEKGNKDRPYYPITHDFADFLRTTKPRDRVGTVFRPIGSQRQEVRSMQSVGRQISLIGQAAKIEVGRKIKHSQGNKTACKFATAHDLRRSFASRWAAKVPPALLQQLMRHESIQTTMNYYVEVDAKKASEALRQHDRDRNFVDRPPRTTGIGSLATENTARGKWSRVLKFRERFLVTSPDATHRQVLEAFTERHPNEPVPSLGVFKTAVSRWRQQSPDYVG